MEEAKHARCSGCQQVFECGFDRQSGYEIPPHNCNGKRVQASTVPGQGLHTLPGTFVDPDSEPAPSIQLIYPDDVEDYI